MPKNPRILAFAQLLRLPNVFTAFADVCLAAAATGLIADRPGVFVLLLLASGSLYLAGMVWNDFFGRREDAKTQPFRPIPSGRVQARTAFVLALILTLCGLGFAALASLALDTQGRLLTPWVVALGIVAAVLLYDGWLKHTPVGPVAMGSCRFLNVLMGLSAAPDAVPDEVLVHLPAVVGVYIVGVTWFARTEETTSNRRHLMLAFGVMVLALVAALMLPVHFAEGRTAWYFPFLLVGFGFHIGVPVVAAVRRPEPKLVQAAVKRCILGLVVLDAVLATAFVGLPGLLVVLLLLPARWLGKWVYST